MGDKTAQNAYEYMEFLYFVLGIFDRDRFHIAALIGKSVNENRAFARKLGSIFVGCNSHTGQHCC